jgi:hypothetical protein
MLGASIPLTCPRSGIHGYEMNLPPTFDQAAWENPAPLPQGGWTRPTALASSIGALWPIELCGLASLPSSRHAS